MRVNKLFSTLVVILLTASVTYAQVNKNYDGVRPEVMKGAKNFVFMYRPFQSNLESVPAGSYTRVNSSGDLEQVDVAGIGFRYFVSNQFSLTGGVNFGSSSIDIPVGTSTANMKMSTFGISLDGNYHLPSLYSVSPYVGLNVNFGSGSSTTDDGAGVKTETSGSSLGIGANFGFDWYFTEGISLGGKYTLGFRNYSAPETTVTGGVTPGTTTGPKGSTIGTGIMSVMMNVHF